MGRDATLVGTRTGRTSSAPVELNPAARLMTPPGIASARLGWCVVRVVVPGLQPMHGHHALPFLGGPLWAPRPLADWANVLPHPFP